MARSTSSLKHAAVGLICANAPVESSNGVANHGDEHESTTDRGEHRWHLSKEGEREQWPDDELELKHERDLGRWDEACRVCSEREGYRHAEAAI
eukprot:CAMPEP_0119419556 /NCGR_PEP_ID=MMETSP1335-20130426/21170_1 /TAXON_ID=259385 /ORGANISM="Chrysoculter rhomboideus, Strain RCC1486" /LENGTH=93 /DNA_ID=CAMNT_0007444869 /DNA_START=104 /DNA_END=382 /DNA_ORIENTATION=+